MKDQDIEEHFFKRMMDDINENIGISTYRTIYSTISTLSANDCLKPTINLIRIYKLWNKTAYQEIITEFHNCAIDYLKRMHLNNDDLYFLVKHIAKYHYNDIEAAQSNDCDKYDQIWFAYVCELTYEKFLHSDLNRNGIESTFTINENNYSPLLTLRLP